MPSRFTSLAILIYWSIATFCLLTWEVIPELSPGYAPDLRSIAGSGDTGAPVRWAIQVMDDPRSPDARRTVGEAVTKSSRRGDRWVDLTSRVELDAGGLLKNVGSAITVRPDTEIRFRADRNRISTCLMRLSRATRPRRTYRHQT